MNWECRQCPAAFESRAEMSDHLGEAHGLAEGLDSDQLFLRLHASKDSPEWSENTYGYYDTAGRLLALHVRREERAADDPMRFGG